VVGRSRERRRGGRQHRGRGRGRPAVRGVDPDRHDQHRRPGHRGRRAGGR
jgi:hypothetical protein